MKLGSAPRAVGIGRLLMAAIALASGSGQILSGTRSAAQPPHTSGTASTQSKNTDKLRFVLILSRHGVRSPTAEISSLNQWSSEAWPDWEVSPGTLTPHGGKALEEMGHYLTNWLSTSGLWTSGTCLQPREVYLYADTDQRNLDSIRATFRGFRPECGPYPIFQLQRTANGATRDPIFVPMVAGVTHPPTAELLRETENEFNSHPEFLLGAENPAVAELVTILSPAQLPKARSSIRDVAQRMSVNPAGDPLVTIHGPIAVASGLIANLGLEYANGAPLSQVGWGRFDQGSLNRLSKLNAEFFNVLHRTPAAAEAEASNMLKHVLDTLDQAGHPRTTVAGSFGGRSTKLVYLSGHDTNLASLGALLAVHWELEGVADAVPPDSQLAFELWERTDHATGRTSPVVRLRYRAQTWDQLRNASVLDSKHGQPREQVLHVPGCGQESCGLERFLRMARSKVNPSYAQAGLPKVEEQ